MESASFLIGIVKPCEISFIVKLNTKLNATDFMFGFNSCNRQLLNRKEKPADTTMCSVINELIHARATITTSINHNDKYQLAVNNI